MAHHLVLRMCFMTTTVLRRILSGVIGGMLVGGLVGIYVTEQTSNYVVQQDDYLAPSLYEQATGRYRHTILLAFVVSFALIGPFVANASFGDWLRPAVYGMVGAFILLILFTNMVSLLSRQPSFNPKGPQGYHIDAARNYGVPAAVILGPAAGLLLQRWRSKPRGSLDGQ